MTYARTHQHIATDSAQTRVRHHQDQEPDRPKASGPLGVQVSAINYFHTRRPAATGKDAVGSPGPDACRCRPFTASLLSHRGLAPGALKKSHINLFFVQRTSFDKLPPALGGSIQPSLLGADKKHKRPDEARPFLGFPASAAPRRFCSRRGKSMGRVLKRRYGITLRAGGFMEPAREEPTTTPPTSPAGDAGTRIGWLRGSGGPLSWCRYGPSDRES